MFENYVFKIRRDFSCLLIPRGAYPAGTRRKKQVRKRTYLNSRYHLNAHAADCRCSCCLSDGSIDDLSEDYAHSCECGTCLADELLDERPVSVNDSENGYLITSRSRQAIKNAANSIFFRSEHKEYLRFVTFTFPPVPVKHETKVQEDQYLHQLFKKFLDNERKNYGLKRWLWTNERQSGDRLEQHEKQAREVLHYHCIFEYEDRVNYYLVNLRFLRLLHRNNFDILSSYSKTVKKNSFQYSQLKKTCQAIAKGDYNYLIEDTERMYIRDELGIKRFVFLSPVDFERIRYSSLDIGKISAYITKYISKSSDKIFCRRWGSSRGLVISDSQLKEFAEANFPKESIDYDTGEIIISTDIAKVFNFFIMGDMSTKLRKFNVEVFGKDHEFIYIPPNWQKWRNHSKLSEMFKQCFNYNI